MLREQRVARVAIIGGGIAGLTVALARQRAGDAVTLLESAPTLGGQLRTEREGEYVIEHGAEGFVASSRALEELASDVGIRDRLIGQLTLKSFGFDGQRLVPLGPGEAAQFLGFQVARGDLGRGIRAFEGGMGEVVEAIGRALDRSIDLRVGTRVDRLTRSGSAWQLELPGASLSADCVVVATGAGAAAGLLGPEFGAAARELGRAAALSSVTVSLAYARSAIAHPLDGTGFVVAESAQVDGLRACTFTSSKLSGRAPASRALLRAFFRPTDDELDRLDEGAWALRAERGIARVLAPSERPERSWVARWWSALPVSDAAHEARVAELERALFGTNIVLAGAAFHGSGIDAAVRSARRAAAFTA
jgi:oxygen-dependent protoporphyrinogen oxidase